jgi:hypothetical protein
MFRQLILALPPEWRKSSLEAGQNSSLAPWVVRLQGTLVPVLAPEALDPGFMGRQAEHPVR